MLFSVSLWFSLCIAYHCCALVSASAHLSPRMVERLSGSKSSVAPSCSPLPALTSSHYSSHCLSLSSTAQALLSILLWLLSAHRHHSILCLLCLDLAFHFLLLDIHAHLSAFFSCPTSAAKASSLLAVPRCLPNPTSGCLNLTVQSVLSSCLAAAWQARLRLTTSATSTSHSTSQHGYCSLLEPLQPAYYCQCTPPYNKLSSVTVNVPQSHSLAGYKTFPPSSMDSALSQHYSNALPITASSRCRVAIHPRFDSSHLLAWP